MLKKILNAGKAPLIDQLVLSASTFALLTYVSNFVDKVILGTYVAYITILLIFQSIQHAAISFPAFSELPKQKNVNAKEFYVNYLLNSCQGLQLIFIPIAFFTLKIYLAQITTNALSFGTIFSFTFTLFCSLNFDFVRKYYIASSTRVPLIRLTLSKHLFELLMIVILSLNVDLNINHICISTVAAIVFSFLITIKDLPIRRFIDPASLCESEKLSLLAHKKIACNILPLAIMQWTSGGAYLFQAGLLLGADVLAGIKLCQNLLSPFNILNQIVDNWFTKVVHRYGKRKFSFNKYKKDILIFLISLVIAFCVLAYFSSSILGKLYGSDYSIYGFLLPSFFALLLLTVFNTAIRSILAYKGIANLLKYSSLITSAIAIIFSKHLIASLSLNGFVIGLMITQLVTTAISLSSLLLSHNLNKQFL